MKKGLLASYVYGITDVAHGESYNRIIRYLIPEFITAFLLYSMPFLLDAYFIGHLKSTSTYGTLGATNNLIHFIIKLSEGFAVSTVILSGRFSGMGNFKQSGKVLRDAFWVTFVLGFAIASVLYLGAHWIYTFYVPEEMVALGVPFLRLRAISIFLMFLSFAFVGFLRGVKNTKIPMAAFILGVIVFIFFDYALIFGKFGFSPMGLQGSAVASIAQYVVMVAALGGYVLYSSRYSKYEINLLSVFTEKTAYKDILRLSWPVILDKAALAFAYIWLCAMIKSLGTAGVATFCVLKDMERFALVPALGGAQIITFLVSNDFGIQNWEGIKSNIKKVIFLSSVLVFAILVIFIYYATSIIQCFDRTCEFTDLAARVFPIISVLVFFDLLQLVLSGALRGAGNVKLVMTVRLLVCGFYFLPVSYILSQLSIEDTTLKLVLIYGSFYIGNALMSIVYINRFRGEDWKTAHLG
jgi:putative MATE family efflux protein